VRPAVDQTRSDQPLDHAAGGGAFGPNHGVSRLATKITSSGRAVGGLWRTPLATLDPPLVGKWPAAVYRTPMLSLNTRTW
jgi:hypothetical protein